MAQNQQLIQLLQALTPRATSPEEEMQAKVDAEQRARTFERDRQAFPKNWHRLENVGAENKIELVPVLTEGRITAARAHQQSEQWLDMFLWYVSKLDGNTLMAPLGVNSKMTLKKCYLDEAESLGFRDKNMQGDTTALMALAIEEGWSASLSSASDVPLSQLKRKAAKKPKTKARASGSQPSAPAEPAPTSSPETVAPPTVPPASHVPTPAPSQETPASLPSSRVPTPAPSQETSPAGEPPFRRRRRFTRGALALMDSPTGVPIEQAVAPTIALPDIVDINPTTDADESSVICGFCQSPISLPAPSEYAGGQPDANLSDVEALECGHVFHVVCLAKDASVNRRQKTCAFHCLSSLMIGIDETNQPLALEESCLLFLVFSF